MQSRKFRADKEYGWCFDERIDMGLSNRIYNV